MGLLNCQLRSQKLTFGVASTLLHLFNLAAFKSQKQLLNIEFCILWSLLLHFSMSIVIAFNSSLTGDWEHGHLHFALLWRNIKHCDISLLVVLNGTKITYRLAEIHPIARRSKLTRIIVANSSAMLAAKLGDTESLPSVLWLKAVISDVLKRVSQKHHVEVLTAKCQVSLSCFISLFFNHEISKICLRSRPNNLV